MTHNMHLFLFIALLNYFLYIPKLAVTDENFILFIVSYASLSKIQQEFICEPHMTPLSPEIPR